MGPAAIMSNVGHSSNVLQFSRITPIASGKFQQGDQTRAASGLSEKRAGLEHAPSTLFNRTDSHLQNES